MCPKFPKSFFSFWNQSKLTYHKLQQFSRNMATLSFVKSHSGNTKNGTVPFFLRPVVHCEFVTIPHKVLHLPVGKSKDFFLLFLASIFHKNFFSTTFSADLIKLTRFIFCQLNSVRPNFRPLSADILKSDRTNSHKIYKFVTFSSTFEKLSVKNISAWNVKNPC